MTASSELDLRNRLDGLALFLERASVRYAEKQREAAESHDRPSARYYEGRSTMAEQCAKFIRWELGKVGPPWLGLDSLPSDEWAGVEA